jgi:hypothetical protein
LHIDRIDCGKPRLWRGNVVGDFFHHHLTWWWWRYHHQYDCSTGNVYDRCACNDHNDDCNSRSDFYDFYDDYDDIDNDDSCPATHQDLSRDRKPHEPVR